MRLRQVAFVAENLMQVREELFQLLGLSEDYADPGVGEFGLENSVMTIGDTFLEVVSPTQTGTTAGRLLERRQGQRQDWGQERGQERGRAAPACRQ